MVEQSARLDAVFSSLADPTRRDILRRVAKKELTVGEIAASYNLTFAAISKHLMVLEKANLVSKRRDGKTQMVQLAPKALADVEEFLKRYQTLWEARLDRLQALIEPISK
ncbi:MAG: winged helix-turn-helix transcriptional regulator [Patescibacteria group bacterium]|nr:winged helix-turn-helix transcriptional regulator [Patescibacteria group bacterium]